MTSLYNDVKAQSNLSLLSRLSNLADKVKLGESEFRNLPLIRIDLESGKTYEGYVWDFDETNLVILQTEGRGGLNSVSQLSFLEIERAVQLTFLQPDSAVSFLKSDVPGQWGAESSLSALQTKRALQTAKNTLMQTYKVLLLCPEDNFEQSGSANARFRDLVSGLCEYFEKTSADSVGSSAIKKINSIQITPSAANDVKLNENQIEVFFNSTQDLPPKEVFFSNLDKVL